MNNANRHCVAGYGQKISVWATIDRGKLTECAIEEPRNHERIEVNDTWFSDHVLVVPVDKRHGPKTKSVCPYLTLQAGKKAAAALRDYSVTALAMALVSQYGWQIANGAQSLPEKGELAKVYAGANALYVFGTRSEKAEGLTGQRSKAKGRNTR